MEPNLTALVSCFARAYHTTHNPAPVFRDAAAQALLTEEESAAIAAHMAAGVSFFAPGFQGSAEEALRAVAEGHLAPAVVARSAFCEDALRSAAAAGCTQYLLFAAGYDTFSVRPHSPALTVYELDRPAVLADKRARLDRADLRPCSPVRYVPCDLAGPDWPEALLGAGFSPEKTAFASLLGLAHYLTEKELRSLLLRAAALLSPGSLLVLDYPAGPGGADGARKRALASAAGEQMRSAYPPGAMEGLLKACGFSLREQRSGDALTRTLCAGSGIVVPEGVCCCLARREKE